ncbi:MAG: N-acetyltransferase, partial [Planctomycetota bacterium]
MSFEVRRVGKNRSDRKAFIRVLWELYKGDPNWVPPLIFAQEELVGFRKHPYYDVNTVECFIAVKDGRPVGRIAAHTNVAHNERYEENRGFFGFFECIDDQEVANALFREAALYHKNENGLSDIRGPINPSLNYEVGTLIDGFNSPPTFMMTYNQDYHDRLIKGFGFEKKEDMFAFEGHIDMLATLDPKLQFVVDELRRRFNVSVRPFDTKNFMSDVELFL